MTCPHCLGPGCLHCREYYAERSRFGRARSRLTPQDRRDLQLLPRRPLRFLPPGSCPPPTRRRGIGLAVLPADFHLGR